MPAGKLASMLGTQKNKRSGARLDWSQVRILYVRELRAALRERAIVVNSILLPLFLYPFILWAGFTGLMFVQGQTEGFASRVQVAGWPHDHPALPVAFERDSRIHTTVGPDSRAADRIREGGLDGYLEFIGVTNASVPGNFEVKFLYDESKERSVSARDRVHDVLRHYRDRWLQREARARGVGAAAWEEFSLSESNVASKRQMGRFILGLMLPTLFVVMVAMGCFYPAVDSTAGERERNTWETLMSTAAGRGNIVAAKYLYVTTMGGMAGMLNITALALTMKPILAPLLAKAGDFIQVSLPLPALPVALVAAVLLAGFVSAMMMIFAVFARTFREGQAMITPFYLLTMLPAVFLQMPGMQFTLKSAWLPIVNVTLMVRAAVSGEFPAGPILLTVAVSLALIAGCLLLATRILRNEDVITGNFSGGLNRFVQQQFFRRAAPGPGAPGPHSHE
ncbi:MAG: ABC transporter permease subunit [Verrucomicrobiota bacterium]